MGHGHDFGPPFVDGVGAFYIILACLWTALVVGGLVMLHGQRHSVAIRIRNFPLLASSIVMIHVYVLAVLLVYPLNGAFKCGGEFWIMSTILPFGFALFQASNIQLLSLYELQRDLATEQLVKRRRRFVPTVSGFLAYWKQLSTVRRTYVGILLGLALQLLITVFLFFGSHIFHKAYGLWGEYGNTARCRRGVEWIPSVFWQFLWSAIFGPYILFRTLHIHDTHYWALQTKLAILACLPGTPLWLAFLYTTTPAVARVNKYFVPAGWFLPGLAAIQVVSIVIPLYDAKKARKLVRRASSICSVSTTASGAGGLKGGKPRDMYSMASLEIQINKNIEPLLRWSAQKEFTAENIVFLKSVRDFKKRWELAFKRAQLSPLQLREQYEEAALIYFTLVSPTTAQFNINIEYRVLSELDELFSGLVYEPYLSDDRKRRSLPASGGVMPSGQDGALAPPALARGDSVVTPWMDIIRPIDTAASSISHEKLVDDDIERLYPTVVTEIEMSSPSGGIPKRFTVNCFDKAFDSVRYLVFTNTWVKFVDAGETVSLAESDMSNDYASKSGFDAY